MKIKTLHFKILFTNSYIIINLYFNLLYFRWIDLNYVDVKEYELVSYVKKN